MKDVARKQMRFLKREVSPQLASVLPKKPPDSYSHLPAPMIKYFFFPKCQFAETEVFCCNVGAFAHISEVPSTPV